jgi:hypothetical protein
LKALLILATILGFMLFPLVFMWAFSTLSRAVESSESSSRTSAASLENLDSVAAHLPPRAQRLVPMLRAARLMSTYTEKDNALRTVVQQALELDAPSVAVQAASEFSTYDRKDSALQAIITGLRAARDSGQRTGRR